VKPIHLPGRGRIAIAVLALVGGVLAATAASTPADAAPQHVANPFVGATQYLSPDYTAEVSAQASADGGALGTAESKVATYPTAVWMDKIAAITGDSVHHGLQFHLDQALAQQSGSTPITFEVVIYDLPGRDCAALASNGEIPATTAGLTEYESQYIDPIAALLGNTKYQNIRIVAIVEPDSLPNAVTNQSKPACATATPFYEQGVEYALNKLHAIPNVYTYVDIAHSAWLGWSSNLTPAAQEFAKVARATTAGFASVDGFISDTANYTPVQEPFLPNPQLNVGGNPLDSVTFYQFNPTFDEYTYDNLMYSALVAQGFPSTIGILIDTSRNGWGGPNRPTALNSSPTTATAYVAANKIDQRPFRGDWCNQNGAGIGARPQAQPFGTSSPIIAYVWIKPPGESDGDYPTSTHSHGDPHCDPAGSNTDGNGGTYATGSFPGFDVPAGQWFGAEFQQLVTNAYPALVAGSGTVTVTSPGSQTGAVGTAQSLTVHATDSAGGTLSYAATGLPTGLSINASTGVISGTPTAAGTFSVTVTATDSSGPSGHATFTWTISAGGGGGANTVTVTNPGNQTGTVGTALSLTVHAADSASGQTLSFSATGLPTGLSVNASTGVISGTPTSAGTYSVTVTAKDTTNATGSTAFTWTISAAGGGGTHGCTASYVNSNDWGNGFTANVTVTNNGTAATTTWKVTWTWGGNQQVVNMWNAVGTQTGTSETATSEPYNGALAPGTNTSFGFQATYSGTNTAPTLTCTAG
jgi:cellulose 1,4-beta-cellobiosidase